MEKPDESASHTEVSSARANLTTVKRVFIVLAALFTAFHVFSTFLWIAPTSQLREVVPGNTLNRYMIPMFGQSWSVFAPNPINGDYRLQVRAVVDDDGAAATTGWVNATKAEMTMHMNHLFPPRAAMSSVDLASRFKGAWDKLNDDQEEVAKLGYYKGDDWQDRLSTAIADNAGKKQNDSVASKYVELDRMASAYATQVAYAMWGEDVQQVQFVVSRQNVIPFGQRNNPDAKRPDVQTAPTGWRGVVEEPGQSRGKFASTFLRGVDNSGQNPVKDQIGVDK